MIERGGSACVTPGFHVWKFTFHNHAWPCGTACFQMTSKKKKKKQKGGRPKISFQQQFGATESVSSVFNYILSHLARKQVWVNMKLVTLQLLGPGLLADPVRVSCSKEPSFDLLSGAPTKLRMRGITVVLIHFIFVREPRSTKPDCSAKLIKPSGLYRLFPGKLRFLHLNECMRNCGVAYDRLPDRALICCRRRTLQSLQTGFLSEWLCCCHPLTLYSSKDGRKKRKQCT